MNLAIINSRTVTGMEATLVSVEVHIGRGLPAFHIVGLPETVVKESKERVRSAIVTSQFKFPSTRVTVNLAPADLPKEGGRFDLPIALGVLVATGQLHSSIVQQHEFVGELALSGELRTVKGILPIVISVKKAGRTLVMPQLNATEAQVVSGAKILTARHLLDVVSYLQGTGKLNLCEHELPVARAETTVELHDIRGQTHAKKSLAIAAAGRHSVLLAGPPGTGKTMLAHCLPSLLPKLSEAEAIEVAAIASVSRLGFDAKQWRILPFRAPHHTSSSVALVGGGRPPKPGEISLAHHGILFLDELPEFARPVLEALREPLESGTVTLARAGYSALYPARFQLVAAMNPCPCGYAGSRTGECCCSDERIERYLNKISGPLLDRIDMQIEVGRLTPELLTQAPTESLADTQRVKEQIVAAHTRQLARQRKYNHALTTDEVAQYCALTTECQSLLLQVLKRFNLSARAYHRILKVARTIADFNDSPVIQPEHISEALTFRWLDRLKFVQK